MLFLFLAILGVGAIISIVGYSLHYGISPMPSSKKCCTIICSLAQGKTIDLGSGWGGLAKRLDADGIEISPIPYFCSRLRGTKAQRKDFFKIDLSSYQTVVCYLYPGAMTRLKEKFESELGEDAVVITNTFAIPGWEAAKVFVVDDLFRSKIRLYCVSDVRKQRSQGLPAPKR